MHIRTAPWANNPLKWAVAAILALTAWRLAMLPFSRMELYVDEAQYWLWGQEMAFGAYSKPPMVGWLIRAANVITGSDAPWVARVPWAICHAIAALALMDLARRLTTPAIAALTGVTYATMPAISLASVLISTDSPMLMFLALSLLLWHRQATTGGLANAIALGTTIGLAFMSKYAMAFAGAGMIVTLLMYRDWRLRPRDALVVAGVAMLVFAPNIIWNLQHGMATMRHTAENADYQGLSLQPDKALRFIFEQFAVAGLLVFAALLAAFVTGKNAPPAVRGLRAIAAAPLVICTIQALNAGANANWAVGAYTAGSILAATVMVRHRLWAAISLLINGILAIALPILPLMADSLRLPNGKLVMARYAGQGEISEWALEHARNTQSSLVANNRALLADLFYHQITSPLRRPPVYAAPPNGPANSHYALLYALPPDAAEPLLWLGNDDTPACADAPIASITPTRGEWQGKTLTLSPLPPACLR